MHREGQPSATTDKIELKLNVLLTELQSQLDLSKLISLWLKFKKYLSCCQ